MLQTESPGKLTHEVSVARAQSLGPRKRRRPPLPMAAHRRPVLDRALPIAAGLVGFVSGLLGEVGTPFWQEIATIALFAFFPLRSWYDVQFLEA